MGRVAVAQRQTGGEGRPAPSPRVRIANADLPIGHEHQRHPRRAAKAALVQPSRPARRRIEISAAPNRAATAGADPKGGAKRHIPDS